MKRFLREINIKTLRVDARRVLVFGLLFAFLAQAQLAVAHFHIGIDAKERALFGLADTKAPAKSKAPLGDRDCPIGQLVAASHNFLSSDGIFVALPDLVVDRALIERDERLAVLRIAHDWQSRAPPCDFSKA